MKATNTEFALCQTIQICQMQKAFIALVPERDWLVPEAQLPLALPPLAEHSLSV